MSRFTGATLVWLFFLSQPTAALAATTQKTVLVTGGAGYIGSHTCLELLTANNKDDDDDDELQYNVVVVDNLDNSSRESLRRVRDLAGVDDSRLAFRNCDIRDRVCLEKVLDEFPAISSCIHFAGLKAVGESVAKPLSYYHANVAGTVTLLQVLQERSVPRFVFSSSATVYGDPEELPITEKAKLQATNPYGRTKLFIEEILRDLHASAPDRWNVAILRYFNPIGAHPSGKIGEDPSGIPNNLMPYIAQVCVGRREKLSIFGNDYPTKDGTGVRDYIHVVDLARGHVAALAKLYQDENGGERACTAINLGTGQGVSVLELVDGMVAATRQPVPYVFAPRRPGDVATVYANVDTAKQFLGWSATLGVKQMCQDTWKWQSTNPEGYPADTVSIEEGGGGVKHSEL